MRGLSATVEKNISDAECMYGLNSPRALEHLKDLTNKQHLSIAAGHLLFLHGAWYVTHSGLLSIAFRRHCRGIEAKPITRLCNPRSSVWIFQAIAYKSLSCKGFVGYGDADPSNVSPLVRGAEMRVAETRAVNRALRKAYGIGICSVEEIGSFEPAPPSRDAKKMPPQPVNGNYGVPKVRDRLCQLIRQHQLDASRVKAYAVDFCGTKTLREASRAQVEAFVVHLADWAEKDRNALLCQLNSYAVAQEGAA